MAGLLVLLAIIGEHKVGKMDAKEKHDANERIEKLEAATNFKPFDERLVTFLNGIDERLLPDRLLPELKRGRSVTVDVTMELSKATELRNLCAEPEAQKYISIVPTVPAFGFGIQSDGLWCPKYDFRSTQT